MKILQCALAALCLSIVLSASAAKSNIVIDRAWLRWLPGDLPAAGYLNIENRGDKPIDLLRESSPDYKTVMLHRSVNADAMERMLMVERLSIRAHGKIDIAPGGYHLMLLHALHPIAPGDKVRVRLEFSDGSAAQAQLIVRPANQAN